MYGRIYANASQHADKTYELTIFDGTGILEQQTGVSESQFQAMCQTGGWRLAAERYSTIDGVFGKVMQFEKRADKRQ